MAQDREATGRRKPGRAPTSCAECRRLKLRCDKQVPCETCIKRGCSAICPEGVLTAGRGSRLILANTEELHGTIDKLRQRVRELEEALTYMQSKFSDKKHPLLLPEMIQLTSDLTNASQQHVNKTTHTPNNSTMPNAAPSPNGSSSNSLSTGSPSNTNDTDVTEPDELEAFGTLAISSMGEIAFYGNSARAEYLMKAPSLSSIPMDQSSLGLSKELLNSCFPEPELPIMQDTVKREMMDALPTLSEASKLCELYLEHGQHSWATISRESLFDEYLAIFYSRQRDDDFTCWHGVSVLFIVFALGALFDPNLPSYSIVAHRYYVLSRVAISFAQPMHYTTYCAIQAMLHMSQYLDLSDWESQRASKSWKYISLAAKMSESVGLHLNSARWKLTPKISEQRSRLFWQVYHFDTWANFNFGRPPSFNNVFIDAPLPQDTEKSKDIDGSVHEGYNMWHWKYAKLLNRIMTTAFAAKMPAYADVLCCDRHIRDFPVPPSLRPLCSETIGNASAATIMQRWGVLIAKENTLLNLHRPYFTGALSEMPHDLMKHRYAPSVMATYRSAWRLIISMKEQYKVIPFVLARTSLGWSQVLSAAIIMCLLATRAPSSSLAPSCVDMLGKVVEMFEFASKECRVAALNLPTLRSLHSKARGSTTAHTHDELDRLGGKTQVVKLEDSPSNEGRPTSKTPGDLPYDVLRDHIGDIGGKTAETAASSLPVHSTILHDLQMFDDLDFSSFGPNAPRNRSHLFDQTEPNPVSPSRLGLSDQLQSLDTLSFDQLTTNGYQQNPAPAFNNRPPTSFFDNAQLSQPMVSQGFTQQDIYSQVFPSAAATETDMTWNNFIQQLGIQQ